MLNGLAYRSVARYQLATTSRSRSIALSRARLHSIPVPPITSQVRKNHTSSPPPPSSRQTSRIEKYLPQLHALSARTSVPLPSLALSFVILHEITAFVPVIALYYLFSFLGAGASIIAWIAGDDVHPQERSTWRTWVGEWYDEGEKRVMRVGKKYNLWTEETTPQSLESDQGREHDAGALAVRARSSRAAEGVANAISAYVVVKALLPFRIGVSIAAAPAFARFALNPIQRVFQRLRMSTRGSK